MTSTKYASKAEKLNAELGEKFTPELEKRIREKHKDEKGENDAKKLSVKALAAQE